MHPNAKRALNTTGIAGIALTAVGLATSGALAVAGVCVAAMGVSTAATIEFLAPDDADAA
jgi:hypothetical protein